MADLQRLRDADCLHDCDRWCESKSVEPPWPYREPMDHDNLKTTQVWCDRCGTGLYRTEQRLNGDIHTYEQDEVYEILYTKEGRRELLLTLMKDANLPIPEHWNDT